MGLCFGLNRAVFISVFGMICSTEIVPEVIVNAEVFVMILVMQIMMRRRIENLLKGFI